MESNSIPLKKLRRNQKIYKKIHKNFHKEFLDKELQEKVIFIDTPGIKLSQTTADQYNKHFKQINEFIKLDEYSIRINLWIFNYTTYSSDKEIQQNMEFIPKNQVQVQVENQNINHQQEQIPQIKLDNKILESIPFFFILNKYDQREKSSDDSMDEILGDIEKSFHSKNVFRISSQDALRYNIMNFGSEQAQERFIDKFYKDDQKKYKFKLQADAKEHCIEYFKKNEELIKDQDFNKFMEETSKKVNEILDNLFKQNLNELDQLIKLLQLDKNLQKAILELTQQQKNKITELLGTFKVNQERYDKKINDLKESFLNSTQNLIAKAIQQIDQNQKQTQIVETCQKAFAEIEQKIQEILKIKKEQIDKIQNELQSILIQNQQLQESSIISERCKTIIKEFLEKVINQYTQQFRQKQAIYVYQTMGIPIPMDFWTKIGMVFARTFLVGGVSGIGLVSLAEFLTPKLLGVVGVAFNIAHFGYSLYDEFSEKKLNLSVLKQQLIEWNVSLENEIEQLVENYIFNFKNTQALITEFMEKNIL